MTNISTSFFKRVTVRMLGNFEYPLLKTILSLGINAYCAQIARTMTEERGKNVSLGQVARSLDNLRNLGLLESKEFIPNPPTKGQRRRIIYTLTPKGQLILNKYEELMADDAMTIGDPVGA